MAEDSKYSWLTRLKPITQVILAIGFCILAFGIGFSLATRGNVSFNKDVPKENKIKALDNAEKNVSAGINDLIRANSDKNVSSDEMKAVTNKLQDAVFQMQKIKEQEQATTELEKYGYESVKLQWVKTATGAFAQIYVLYCDFHLVPGVPYPSPKNFMERWLDIFYLICDAAIKNPNMDTEIKKNFQLIHEIVNETIVKYNKFKGEKNE